MHHFGTATWYPQIIAVVPGTAKQLSPGSQCSSDVHPRLSKSGFLNINSLFGGVGMEFSFVGRRPKMPISISGSWYPHTLPWRLVQYFKEKDLFFTFLAFCRGLLPVDRSLIPYMFFLALLDCYDNLCLIYIFSNMFCKKTSITVIISGADFYKITTYPLFPICLRCFRQTSDFLHVRRLE